MREINILWIDDEIEFLKNSEIIIADLLSKSFFDSKKILII